MTEAELRQRTNERIDRYYTAAEDALERGDTETARRILLTGVSMACKATENAINEMKKNTKHL